MSVRLPREGETDQRTLRPGTVRSAGRVHFSVFPQKLFSQRLVCTMCFCHFSRTKHSWHTRFLIDMHTHTRGRARNTIGVPSPQSGGGNRGRALHASVLYYFRVREISSESPRLIYHGSRPEFFGFTRPRKLRIPANTNVAQVNTCLYTYAGSAGVRALCACH